MGRILFGVIAAVALFMLVQGVAGKPAAKRSLTKKPLTCNMCSYGLLGFCLSTSEETCSTNTSLCSTGKITFQGLSNVGFNTQGCHEPAGCNSTTNGTLLGVTYIKILECCTTDKCNPVQTSGAPSTKMTLTAAIGVAILASVWGSIL